MTGKTLIRLGDRSDHGGTMITAGGKFKNAGLPGCVQGDLHQCPIHDHGTTPVTATTAVNKTGGKAMLRSGDRAGCGAILLPTNSVVTCA
jgi:uncharacterized Zn-binding protein involved in type VI secretion